VARAPSEMLGWVTPPHPNDKMRGQFWGVDSFLSMPEDTPMDGFPKFSRLSLARQIDSFHWDVEYFERDVHILILGTLHAASTYLSDELKEDLAKLDTALESATGHYAEHLDGVRLEVMEYHYDQQRFLRNMGVVSLSSRLTHALNQMAIHAESFSPRKKAYPGKSEYERFWSEYKERFGLDFDAHAEFIAFVKPMVDVRNRIIHDGGQANRLKTMEESTSGDTLSFEKNLDRWFSNQYPQFVEGEGRSAEVKVSQEQLEDMLDQACKLVRWLAAEMRERQLAHAAAQDTDDPNKDDLISL